MSVCDLAVATPSANVSISWSVMVSSHCDRYLDPGARGLSKAIAFPVGGVAKRMKTREV